MDAKGGHGVRVLVFLILSLMVACVSPGAPGGIGSMDGAQPADANDPGAVQNTPERPPSVTSIDPIENLEWDGTIEQCLQFPGLCEITPYNPEEADEVEEESETNFYDTFPAYQTIQGLDHIQAGDFLDQSD